VRDGDGKENRVTQLTNGRAGRRPTLEDVGARAGVSRALASRVIRGAPGASAQARERVVTAAAELGYRPDTRARLLAQRSSQSLGVVFGMQHAFHAALVDGLYDAAEAGGYELVLSARTPSHDEGRAVETLLDYRCEALILLGSETRSPWLAAVAAGLPVIVVGGRVRDPAIDVIRSADPDGMRQAIDHLVALGHRQIVHVDGGHGLTSADRRRGYRTAMRRHGLAEHGRIIPGGEAEESGAAAAQQILDEGALPTAVVAYNDDCAVGVLDALVRAGVDVPADMSVVGYDDTWIARLSHINLTTVGQNAPRMANLTVERAVARLAGEDVADREVILPPHLIVRGTTGVAQGRAEF
jgi:DNA-binding LacI/PurR family transcriptional regulator